MGSKGVPELPAAASPLAEGSPPPSFQSDRVKALKQVEPVDIQWERVTLRVPAKGGAKKTVLADVSGQLRAACITAIMGATGCGKTSLLNCLSGRVQFVRGAKLTGRLLTNGAPRDQDEFANISAYVTQDDHLYPQLTVAETLTLAGRFSLGGSMPAKDVEAYVTSVINDLGLKKARDTVIGDAMTKGVSGGERKRVSIGVELISNPSALFLDEPTSGLDAFQALSVMQAMKELAGAGRTVVAVIHQPRSSIFSMLDDLVLLSEGRTVYVGPAKDAHAWFARQGFACPAGATPADYFLDIMAKDYRTPALEALSQRRIDRLTAAFALEQAQRRAAVPMTPQDNHKQLTAAAGATATATATATGAGHSSPLARAAKQLTARRQTYGAGWATQLRYLAWRNFAVMSRNTIGRVASTAVPLILSVVLGLIWSNRSVDPQKALLDKIGLLFMVCINIGFGGMNETLQTFPIEKRTVQKERASGFYSLSAYYCSKVLTATPFALVGPFLFCCILYPAAGLRAGAEYFFTFVAVVLAETLCAGALGMLISSIAGDPEIANAMAPAFNILLTVYNGVLINVDNLPNGSQWIAEIGYNRWTFEAFALNEFQGRSYACPRPPNGDAAACIRSGDQLLKIYGYGDGGIGRCIGYLLAIAAVTHALAFLNLWRASTRYLAIEAAEDASNTTAAAGVAVPALPSAEEEQQALEEVSSRGTDATRMAPVPAVDLAWRDVEMLVPIKGGRKEGQGQGQPQHKAVLDKVSGAATSGTLTAIMGPSGSGKSSLLNLLAGRVLRVKGGALRGTLLTNGHPREEAAFQRISAFVIQDDLLFGHLTVQETLTLAAHFALGSGVAAAGKAALVGTVVADLGLGKTVNTIIGDERARGVSGGERKRVSIGVELISNPSVLFLDEPTSGLDAFAALSVMQVMQKLARSGRTVVASIHQPRSAIFELLDRLVLISEGRTVYLGPAKDAGAFFAAQGLMCPPLFNQSDFFLDSISMDYRTPELEAATRMRITALADAWAKEQGKLDGADDEEAGGAAAALVKARRSCRDLAAASAAGQPQHRAGWLSNLWHLTGRAFKSAYRNAFAIGLRTVMNVFFALLFSAIWHDVRRDQPGIQSLIGLLFMAAANTSFGNIQATINTFPVEKAVVIKEQASSAYRLSAYFVSKFLSELPLNLLGPALFGTLLYWIVDFSHSFPQYGLFLATLGMTALSSVAMGILISTLAPTIQVAASLGPLPNIVFLIFSGVLINLDSLPAGAKWVASISHIQWCVRALALNEFTGATFSCTPGQRCLATGEDVLSLYSWDGSSIGLCLLYLACIMAAFLLLGYGVLRRSLPRYMSVAKPAEGAVAAAAATAVVVGLS